MERVVKKFRARWVCTGDQKLKGNMSQYGYEVEQMVSAWGVDEPDEERREEKPGKTSVLIGSLLQAQIYGVTCSNIGSMYAKMQNKSRRLAEHVRIEIN